MLHNANSLTASLLNWIQMHPDFNFYLTGSRFFGGSTEDSDFDFFVANSETPSLIAELESWGFKDFTSDYEDSSIFKVMSVQTTDDLLYDRKRIIKIDIQILKPEMLQRKITAQTLLQDVYPDGLPGIYKTQRDELWKLALRAAALLEKQVSFSGV